MEYSVKRIEVDEESLLEITRFLNATFPKNKKFSIDFVRWQYAQNPLGHMLGFNAWDNGKIVSHFAGLRINIHMFGKIRKGLLCINVGTLDEYRGKKLFSIVGERTTLYAIENGFDFLIAVPNANSTHAFLKYFGYYLVSPLTVKVGFGKNIFKDKNFNCYKCWDDGQWLWRLSNPTNKYSFDAKGILSTPISFFAKTLAKTSLPENFTGKFSKSLSLRPLNLYVGLGADTSKGLYFNIPSFIKRPPFNLVFKDLTGEIPVIKKEDFFLQLIDLDTI